MKEQDMIHRLMEEEIEIPESIQPENIYQQLLKIDEERGADGSATGKTIQRGYIKMKKAAFTGAAVAAGLAICVLAAVQGPVRSSLKSSSVTQGEALPKATAAEGSGANGQVGEETAAEADYQPVFQRLQEVQKLQEKRAKKNEGKQIFYDLAEAENSMSVEDSAGGSSAEAKTSGSAQTSQTNVRTQGVDEGDVVKTDGKYIYSYRSDDEGIWHCYIYQANQAKTKKVATISFSDIDFDTESYSINDMYLSEGKLVLVAGRIIDSKQKQKIKKLYQKAGGDFHNFCKDSWAEPGYACYDPNTCGIDDVAREEDNHPWVYYSSTLIYDISDSSNPVLERELFQDGAYESSRVVDGTLYLISRRAMNTDKIREKDARTFVPQIGGECVSADKVDLAAENETACYQVLSSVDIASGEYIDTKTVLGGGNQIYVSGESIYLIDQFSVEGEQTILLKYSYQDGRLKKEAEGKIKGYLNDDYAIDEQGGYLRAVTTYYQKGKDRNAVFILDSDLKQCGKIMNIAPKESVYAVRFMGDLVYFVTFEETDPVFVADLSDPAKPEIIGELKLPGFSSYLHPIGEDLMVGIGETENEDGDRVLKLSLFDTSNPKKIKEIHKSVLPDYNDSEVLQNPNALFVDAEKQFIGFMASSWSGMKFDYLVYQVDREKGFVEKSQTNLQSSHTDIVEAVRGLYIDRYFYIVEPGRKIRVLGYPDFKKLS